ncbi:MAG: DUF4412 domain-containing protein [Cyanobacteria bacterium SZAS LIN-3]|nr:DUF4412 domain-containing protein [Cyanobacteria bacterium SZAS LIN-3]MBS2009534.1 DUF4412 domain-containing protein [Cyanobacteria bacterium SZAS TMP-1]
MKAGQLFTLGLLSLSTAGAALAADIYPKAYDATYENKNSQGTMQMRMMSNGKGMTRTESGAGPTKSVTITDYPGKTSYTIIEANKMIMKGKFEGKAGSVLDEVEAKKLGATNLGTKMVNGHMCQGWQYKTKDAKTETWIDNAAQVMVKSTTVAAGLTNEMNMKTYSPQAPADSNFKVPGSGYTVIARP